MTFGVFFIGGCSLAEVAALRIIARRDSKQRSDDFFASLLISERVNFQAKLTYLGYISLFIFG